MDGRLVAKILILLLIFTGTVFVVNRVDNSGIDEVSVEMEQATLPLVYVRYNNEFINTMHGYTGKVDTTCFRDTITPMNYGQTIELWTDGGSLSYDRYEYELRSQYQGDLLENGEVTEREYANGYDRVKITFRTKLEELSEYVLVLKLMSGEETMARYYSRVVVENDFHAEELLLFVNRFSHAVFDKKEAERVITKSIEPNEDGPNEYLSEVNLHSSFHTITFAELAPKILTKPIPSIKEIDDSYAVIQMKYMIAAQENRVMENYYVTEDFRVRFDTGTGNVYLLDYNREQEAMFDTGNVDVNANHFKLGILQEDRFSYLTSDQEKKLAFVQAGQLWYYDYNDGTITNVFGFCQGNNYTDDRVTYGEHSIRLMEMDDEGNLVFAVCGYMNCGDHEGQVGICVYRFLAGKDKLEELLFIENNKPFTILQEDMEKLLYLNEAGQFFYFDNDCVVRVDTKTKEPEIFIEDVLNKYLAVSEDHHLIGYPDKLLPEDTTKVTVLDLDTMEQREITAGSGERLKNIGFVEEDLILGRVKESDIEVALDKTVTCPISTIDIIGGQNQVIKTYGTEGIYIMQAKAVDGVVYLERARKVNGELEETTQDFITYKEEESVNRVSTVYKYGDSAYNQLYLRFPDTMFIGRKPRLMITRQAVREEDTTVKIAFDHSNKKFYAYGQGVYMDNYLSLNGAVRTAYENSGVVIDSNGLIVWRKIAVKAYHTVADKIRIYNVEEIPDTLAACIYMMGVYEEKNPDYKAMQEALSSGMPVEEVILQFTGRQGTDITGCDFENGLYYLCKDAPVITRFADGTYVLVTSYNGERIRYINPLEKEDLVESREEFEQKVMESGNVFISYVR